MMIIPDRINSLCFTGHRNLTSNEESILFDRLIMLLNALCKRGLTNCYAGGALGLDTLAALAVLKIKEDFEGVKLNLILPCQGQDNAWNDKQKTIYGDIKSKADSVRVLSPFYYNGCMQVRNREMLAKSDLCIAYLRPGTAGGGSLNTVIQATKLGIPIINLANEESEKLI